LPMFTQQEWNSLELSVSVAAVVSFSLSVFMILSFVLNPYRRVFPIRLILNHEICVFLFTLGFLLNGYTNYESLWCENAVEIATMYNSSLCSFQALLTFYFGLASAIWFAILSFNLFLQIKFWDKEFNSIKLERIYHSIAWGFPILTVIINFAAGNVSYPPAYVSCFISIAYNSWLQYATFYIPVTVSIAVISVCSAWTIYLLAKGLNANVWRPHVRLLFFLIWTLYVNFLLVEQRFYQGVHQDDYSDSLAEWTECKIYHSLGVPTNSTCNIDHPPDRISLPTYIADLVSGVGSGAIGFVAFGLDLTNLKFWKEFVLLLFTLNWAGLKSLINLPVADKRRPSVNLSPQNRADQPLVK